MFRGSSGADYPNAVITLGVENKQQCAFDHTNTRKAILAVVTTIIVFVNTEGVRKYEARAGERYAMLGVVGSGLDAVPLEIFNIHKYTA